jgi:RNA polymerase sigma factor (sigma-70 family)
MELSEDEREILALRFSAELSYKEIAEILNVKIGTVMSRLSRLKTKLGNDFLEESDE